jgi:hypothetical protein
MAFPINPPTSPEITAIRTAKRRRKGHRVQRLLLGGDGCGGSYWYFGVSSGDG